MNYVKFETKDKKEMFIEEEYIENLKNLDSLIFDCDGVLLNTANSFDQAIKNAIDYFFTNIIQFEKSIKSFVSNEDIVLLRNTGGLGNDWDLSFIIIFYYISLVLLRFQNTPDNKKLIVKTLLNIPDDFESLQKRINVFISFQSLFKKLKFTSNDLISVKEKGNYKLNELTNKMNSNGLESGKLALIDRLKLVYPDIDKIWIKLENLFGYELPHLDNLIKRLFEEIYLGSEMFKKIYEADPIFYFGPGLIENESLIPSSDLFQKLILNYGFKKFGIASSRPENEALYVLNRFNIITDYFNENALIFLNSIYKEEQRIVENTGEKIRLEKPNPYSLMLTARNITPTNNEIAYIGDTASDLIAVQNANKENEFIFYSICVYGTSPEPEKLKNKFREIKANIIIPDPDNLLDLFEKIGRNKI